MSSSKKSKIDMAQLLSDNQIDYRESQSGWLQLSCPLCGDSDRHLGWNLDIGFFSCWRCGRNSRTIVIAALLGITLREARKVLAEYATEYLPKNNQANIQNNAMETITLPFGAFPMQENHKQYLRERKYDPDKLEREWNLLGTGYLGPFAHRIIIPVYLGGKLISYQARDITGRAKAKYLSCADTETVIPIKQCLYGIDKCRKHDWIVITEGPSKVWRLGAGAVATFGATVTDTQMLCLKRFKRRYILFDDDPAGQEGARVLGESLSIFDGLTDICSVGINDVGDLPQEEANYFMSGIKANIIRFNI